MGSRYPPLPPEHSSCSLIPHMEFKSRVFDWSHKDEDPQPGRFFGRFQCSECPKNWGSVWTWSGRGQKCEICCSMYNWRSVGYTQPYEVKPLERRKRHKRVRTIHTPIYCEYCVELSRSTKPRKNLEHLCRKAIPGDPWARAYTKQSRYDS